MTVRVTGWRVWGLGAVAMGLVAASRLPRRRLTLMPPGDDEDDPVKQAIRSSSPWH